MGRAGVPALRPPMQGATPPACVGGSGAAVEGAFLHSIGSPCDVIRTARGNWSRNCSFLQVHFIRSTLHPRCALSRRRNTNGAALLPACVLCVDSQQSTPLAVDSLAFKTSPKTIFDYIFRNGILLILVVECYF